MNIFTCQTADERVLDGISEQARVVLARLESERANVLASQQKTKRASQWWIERPPKVKLSKELAKMSLGGGKSYKGRKKIKHQAYIAKKTAEAEKAKTEKGEQGDADNGAEKGEEMDVDFEEENEEDCEMD